MQRLRHGKVELALHALRAGAGRALLLLHGLGEEARRIDLAAFGAWPGPVFGLDFTGHGESTIPLGGGYFAEVLMADADVALGQLGEATVCGRGLGAYIALLLAGARPTAVRGAILCDGPGLSGGGSRPTTPCVFSPEPAAGAPDPFALIELARDLRPPDYATVFVHQALHLSPLERPIFVCARQRPEWLEAVVAQPGVELASLEEALRAYAT
jgi:pimeloyl-ACP methyl ester carboxylesterase